MSILTRLGSVGVALVLSLLFFLPAEAAIGMASAYGLETCRHHLDPDCPTASGRSLRELVANQEPYCAAWGYRFGTRLRLTNLGNGNQSACVVWDRGPAKRLGRIVDLSPLVFSRLEDLERGLIEVEVEVILP